MSTLHSKYYGDRFRELRRSRNEHLDIRNARAIICRCFRYLLINGKIHGIPKRFRVGPNYRSKYNIRLKR